MQVFSLTPAMAQHVSAIETYGTGRYKDPVVSFQKNVDKFLTDETKDEFDDSKIYEEIAEHEEAFNYDKEKLADKEEIIVEKLSKHIMKEVKHYKDELFEF